MGPTNIKGQDEGWKIIPITSNFRGIGNLQRTPAVKLGRENFAKVTCKVSAPIIWSGQMYRGYLGKTADQNPQGKYTKALSARFGRKNEVPKKQKVSPFGRGERKRRSLSRPPKGRE